MDIFGGKLTAHTSPPWTGHLKSNFKKPLQNFSVATVAVTMNRFFGDNIQKIT